MRILARGCLALSAGAAAALLAGCGGIPATTTSVSERAATPFVRQAAGGWRETTLSSFDYIDGTYDTYSGLVFDADGNLYGTTQWGGYSTCQYDQSCGVAYELTRSSSGAWTETVIHEFSQCDPLGFFPRAPLIVDRKGNLYGTTAEGGPFCSGVGPGAVFELSPNGGSIWTPNLIYQFRGTIDGEAPQAPLTFDRAGNLYGTTSEGGNRDDGTIFELTPQDHGRYWTKTLLHSFTNREGYSPHSRLTFDKAGDLYGTTTFGGAFASGCGGYGCGTAFELTPGKSGTRKLKVLHSFGYGNDGAYPVSALTLDSTGDLFGVTSQGGGHSSGCLAYGCGTVFELTQKKSGAWTEQIIHDFGSGTDGNLPRGDLTRDDAGLLYGTAVLGGRYASGMAYRLSRGTSGAWQEDVLHDFGKGKDGALPYTGMIFDQAHNLYGTTDTGGQYRSGSCQMSKGCGAIFEITPR